MKETLAKLSKDELIAFIDKYAAKDAKLAKVLRVRFGVPVFNDEVKKIEGTIDVALEGVSEYRYNHNRWGYVSLDTLFPAMWQFYDGQVWQLYNGQSLLKT